MGSLKIFLQQQTYILHL
uniref:Uncharacterized protein n=1 Tax=Anguilla anguilla TaxID=7936 RepID=A0A0E9Y2J5_ANGAN